MTCQNIEVVPGLSLLDDQLVLSVGLLVHAVHHLPQVLRLQLLQKVVVHEGIVDQLLGAGSMRGEREIRSSTDTH